MTEVPPLCRSPEEAAQQLRQHSFAIVDLRDEEDETLVKALQQAAQRMRTFFQQDDKLKKYRHIDKDGHLLGFNEPSAAKYLYRVLGERGEEQPWPPNDNKDDDNDLTFPVLSQQITEGLHGKLVQCLAALQKENRPLDASQSGSRRPCKRQKCADNNDYSRYNCPLDFFFYHNERRRPPTSRTKPPDDDDDDDDDSSAAVLVPNCTPHVDRGLLIAICLTPVPGLELLRRGTPPHGMDEHDDRATQEPPAVFCPEEAFANVLQQQKEYSLLCLLTGGQLSTLRLPACVHWVRDELAAPRLSISYELRI